MIRSPFVVARILLVAALWLLDANSRALAADAEFAGVIALIEEPGVAEELRLAPEQKTKLIDLLSRRESDALELAAEIKGLSAEERQAKLAPFASQTEKLGSGLLSAEQFSQLNKIRLRRAGFSSLAEAVVAEKLKLSDEQKQQAEKLVAELNSAMAKGTEAERRAIRADLQRKLGAILTRDQKIAYEQLTGEGNDAAVAADAPATKPGETKTGETKPTDATRTMVKPLASETTSGKPSADGKLRFNFRYAPWKDVLEWFATQADLSLVLDTAPPGTFNYADNRSYTPAEAIDLLNGVLLTKGYTLLRRDRMVMVINLEDGIPPNLVPQVLAKDLDKYGQYELLSCIFPLSRMAPEDAEAEVRKLMGPQGSVIVLPKARQIYVTETAGKLRTVRAVIDSVENPTTPKDEKVVVIVLKHVTPTEFLVLARPLLGIPENANSSPDASLRIAIDELSSRLLITGKAERLDRVKEIVTLVDVAPTSLLTGSGIVETPQLEVYRIAQSDPAAALKVLQTLLAGIPDVRMDLDPKTGNLIALAKPAQHATIKATLDQMQKDGRQVEVVRLRRIDPQVAVLAINKLFGGSEEGASSSGPKIDADPTTSQIFIRGTAGQVMQIRDLLEKMGEVTSNDPSVLSERTNVRVLPLTGRTAKAALEQIEQVWPTMGKNKIRIVTPSTRDGVEGTIRQRGTTGEKPGAKSEDEAASEPKPAPAKTPSTKSEAAWQSAAKSYYVAVVDEEESAPAKPTEKTPPKAAPVVNEHTGAEIVITVGPSGIVIASEDLDALDKFEELLRTVAETSAPGGKEFTVFYLKHCKAEPAAALLQEVLGGAGAEAASGGGGSLMGDMASSMMGDMAGGMLGSLLGGGGGGGGGSMATSAAVSIVSDTRLNALFVQAKAKDLDTVEQLLKVIDREESPEPVQTAPLPRFITCVNTKADEIATIVKQVYASRLSATEGAAGGAQRQPSPEDLIRALRGGSGGGKANARDKKADELKMTIGVDTRTNSLIVSAPDYLFTEVKALVKQLDISSVPTDETVQVVQMKRGNAAMIQRSLKSVLGDSITANKTSASDKPTGSTASSGAPSADTAAQEQARQRMEMFNNLQRLQGGGGGPGGGFGGPGGGGGGRRGGN